MEETIQIWLLKKSPENKAKSLRNSCEGVGILRFGPLTLIRLDSFTTISHRFS